jgi:ribosome-binding protein aMBF1 (putative translation factor)
MWCKLCDDRIIEYTVKINGNKIDVCKSCYSMCGDESKKN